MKWNSRLQNPCQNSLKMYTVYSSLITPNKLFTILESIFCRWLQTSSTEAWLYEHKPLEMISGVHLCLGRILIIVSAARCVCFINWINIWLPFHKLETELNLKARSHQARLHASGEVVWILSPQVTEAAAACGKLKLWFLEREELNIPALLHFQYLITTYARA